MTVSAIFCQVALDSDDGLFGGFSRLDHGVDYFTTVSLGSSAVAFLFTELLTVLKLFSIG
jgi:hypothetical protein